MQSTYAPMADSPNAEHLLFVYGTLKSGKEAHGFLDDGLFVGEGSTKEPMEISIVRGYPALYKKTTGVGPARPVSGEVWVVSGSVLRKIDEYEGATYRRELTAIMLAEGEVEAFAYFGKYADEIAGATPA